MFRESLVEIFFPRLPVLKELVLYCRYLSGHIGSPFPDIRYFGIFGWLLLLYIPLVRSPYYR
jgi:hypothetical protein